MAERDLIDQVLRRMEQLETTQIELAIACGLTQGHLSKVLFNKIKLAEKTSEKLENWLAKTEALSHDNPEAIVQSLASKLASIAPNKRMQFMEFLRIAEQLVS